MYITTHTERVVTLRVRDLIDLVLEHKRDILGNAGFISGKIVPIKSNFVYNLTDAENDDVELRFSIPHGTELNREDSGVD